jgi:2-dehydro-3-deoxygluconokinase
LVLPSFEDEAEWFKDSDPQATTARYATAGAQTIIVKNGAEPVQYLQGDMHGAVEVPPLANVVDSTAAGDSFNAGFLAGVMRNMNLPDSITMACRLARHVVQGRGALVPFEPADLGQ